MGENYLKQNHFLIGNYLNHQESIQDGYQQRGLQDKEELLSYQIYRYSDLSDRKILMLQSEPFELS